MVKQTLLQHLHAAAMNLFRALYLVVKMLVVVGPILYVSLAVFVCTGKYPRNIRCVLTRRGWIRPRLC